MNPKLTIYLLLAITLFTLACKKVPKGVQTKVYGYVTDTAKNKRIGGAKIAILGCKIHPFSGGEICSDQVATTSAGSDGNFQLNFTSNGKYSAYELQLIQTDDYKSAYEYFSYPLNAGKDNQIIVKATEFNTLKFHLKIDKTTADSLTVAVNFKRQTLSAKPLDTILEFKIEPGQDNYIRFVAHYPGYKTRGTYKKIKFGTDPIVNHEQLIPNTDDLPYN
ncbi:hypothetical protein [Pedobacter ghigonis]|uniref:hypothetical protein n=1 Tax=Pedobacter ghigonis TaxID=2730403 RepID=UPI000FA07705|nr:hypothetical protein [Pedobacter ghigonis]